MKNSAINWTDHTANFWWGCQKVSDGCKHCYAETLSKRYGKDIWGPPKTTEREPKLGIWSDIKKWDREARAEGIRRRVFVSSMSDFLEDHPMVYEAREMAMDTIEKLEWLDILMLTKRPENAPRFLERWWNDFPSHVWMGTTVENQKAAEERIMKLYSIPAKIKFLSVEPMLESIEMEAALWQQIDWVICGGESGAGCRPFDIEWAYDLLEQCKSAGVAFWMKQLGGHPNKRHELSDLPEVLRVRELPK
jgi:protein gp37